MNISKVGILAPDLSSDQAPLHDAEAERMLLGACLLNPNVFHRVSGIVSEGDFYRSQHPLIYAAIRVLALAGKQIDTLTVRDQLQLGEQLAEAGGITYLSSLDDTIPNIANAEDYARIVKRLSRQRQNARIGATLYQDSQDRSKTPEEAAGEALRALAAEGGGDNQSRPMYEEVLRVEHRRIEVMKAGMSLTIRTGFREHDHLGVIRRGCMTIVAAPSGHGKAQPVWSKVLTPRGWKLIWELKVGDQVIGSDGKATTVLGVYPRGEREIFRVTTTDGSSTHACAEHLWQVASKDDRPIGKKRVITTADLAKGIRLKFTLPRCEPVTFDDVARRRAIHPYLLGVLIGDGCLTNGPLISNPEEYIAKRVRETVRNGDTVHIRNFGPGECPIVSICGGATRAGLAAVGLLGLRSHQRFIPEAYLLAPLSERIELLHGLCDTDGYVNSGTSIEYATTSPRLKDDVVFLAKSLGARVTVRARPGVYTKGGEHHQARENYRINMAFRPGFVPVSSPKHLARWKVSDRRFLIRVQSVEPAGVATCVCIRVAAEDGLYVTDDFIVTHNSTLMRNFATGILRCDHSERIAYYSLEERAEEFQIPLLCQMGRILKRRMKDRTLTASEDDRLGAALEELRSWRDQSRYFFADRIRDFEMIHADARRLKATSGLSAIFVDFAQLVAGMEEQGSNRTAQADRIGRGFALLAQDLDIAVIIGSQVNKEREKRGNGRLRKEDMKNCSALAEHASSIVMFQRPREDDKANTDVKWCKQEHQLEKNRGDETGDIVMHADMPTCTITEGTCEENDCRWLPKKEGSGTLW